jgi:hypothetical protein
VSNALPEVPIKLLGSSNGESWVVPNWGTVDFEGRFSQSGMFGSDTVGTHSLTVEIGGLASNNVAFEVVNCRR